MHVLVLLQDLLACWKYLFLLPSRKVKKLAMLCRWSAEFGAHRYGSPELHDMLADYMYSESPEVVHYRS